MWATVESIAPKMGCVPSILRDRVKHAEVDAGARPGTITGKSLCIKGREREVKQLRQAHEILKLASALFAQAAVSSMD